MKIDYRRILPLLKLATKAIDKIPTKKDTWPERVAKILALLDVAHETYGGGRSKMRDITDRYTLVERESDTFVRIFFSTTLRDLFTTKRITLDDREDLIEAVAPDGERLFFRETHYGNTRIESDFFHTAGIDFARVIDRLWQGYPNGIYLSVTNEAGGWRKETTICEVPAVPVERLSRHARARLDATVALHQHFVADHVHRCYLLFGPARSGKSTFEVLFARAFGGKALKLDATSLPLLSVKEVGFLLETLRPNFLIIDDLDRAPIAEVGPRVLFLLERLKTTYPALTILLSVNDTTKLDPALLGCGRIDIPIEFHPPERDEVEQMVRALFAEYEVPAERATAEVVGRIVETALMDHMTHAYVDDLVRRLRHEPVDDVIASVHLLKTLADKSTKAVEAPGGGAPSTDPPKMKG